MTATATADALMAIFGFKRVEGSEMKTDRELLELAAKAAGVSFFVDSWGRYMEIRGGLMPTPWNPLSGDGDALRLAVSAGVDISDAQVRFFDKDSSDPCAATRRAIVRAAAAIGEGMQ